MSQRRFTELRPERSSHPWQVVFSGMLSSEDKNRVLPDAKAVLKGGRVHKVEIRNAGTGIFSPAVGEGAFLSVTLVPRVSAMHVQVLCAWRLRCGGACAVLSTLNGARDAIACPCSAVMPCGLSLHARRTKISTPLFRATVPPFLIRFFSSLPSPLACT